MQHTQQEPAGMVDLGLYVPFLLRLRRLVRALESEPRLSSQTIWDSTNELVPTDPLGVLYLSQWYLVSEAVQSASATNVAYHSGGHTSSHDFVDCVIQGLQESRRWVADHIELYPSSATMLDCDGEMITQVWQAFDARVAARQSAVPTVSSTSSGQDSAATSHSADDRFDLSFCGDEHCDLCLIPSVPCSCTSSYANALASCHRYSAGLQGLRQGDLESLLSNNSASSNSGHSEVFQLLPSSFSSPASYPGDV